MTLLFEDIKNELLPIINEKIKFIPHDPKGFTLIEGFISCPLQKEFTRPDKSILSSIATISTSIPLVAVIGNSSGVIYYLSIKYLMPKLKM